MSIAGLCVTVLYPDPMTGRGWVQLVFSVAFMVSPWVCVWQTWPGCHSTGMAFCNTGSLRRVCIQHNCPAQSAMLSLIPDDVRHTSAGPAQGPRCEEVVNKKTNMLTLKCVVKSLLVAEATLSISVVRSVVKQPESGPT